MLPYYQDNNVTLYHGDCLEIMPNLTQLVDAVLTDPPYEYISTLAWDKPGYLDKKQIVNCLLGVMSKDSIMAIFGRGTSFYRLNVLLEDAGLKFKEEVIWNKKQSTSPCHLLHRVHETCAIFAKGGAIIRRSKIPYMEKKQFDLQSIVNDVKRIKSALNNPVELDAILKFLSSNLPAYEIASTDRSYKHSVSQHHVRSTSLRGVMTFQALRGLGEESILCVPCENEVDIFECGREHYHFLHPTQKPVRLFERLLNVICDPGALVLDPFAGSGTTGIAAIKSGRKAILIEKEEKYCEIAAKRISEIQKQPDLFTQK